jgi:Ion transport protein
VLLGLFCCEIFVNVLAYGVLYMKDLWNIFDIIIIILSLAFVLLDLLVNNSTLSGFLRIRSVFRILRIFILVRKLSTLKQRREIHKR